MDGSTLYRRAVSAVALPLLLWLSTRTIYPRLVVSMASEHLATRWLLTLLGLVLVGVESIYFAVLVGLIRARGSPDRYRRSWVDPAAQSRRRRRRLRLAAACFSIVVALGCAEIAFRLIGIDASRNVLETGACVREVDNTLNALGIREDWDSIAADDPRVRIAFLGDSFTYGDSVERVDTFSHLLEDLLADACANGVITINLGKAGTAPGTQREIYLRVGRPLEPDVVVHVLYPNDLGVGLHFLLLNLHKLRNDDPWVGHVSRVLAFAELQVRYWILWNETLGYFRGGRTEHERRASWAKFEADLRACRRAAEEDGAAYAIVLFPWIYRLSDHPLRDVHERIAAIASDMGVPFLDLYATLAAYPEEDIRICHVDDHPNPKGHRIAARRIAQFLRNRVLPDVSACADVSR